MKYVLCSRLGGEYSELGEVKSTEERRLLLVDVAEPRCPGNEAGTSIDLLGLDEKEDDREKVWENRGRGEKRTSLDEIDGVKLSGLLIYCDVRMQND